MQSKTLKSRPYITAIEYAKLNPSDRLWLEGQIIIGNWRWEPHAAIAINLLHPSATIHQAIRRIS